MALIRRRRLDTGKQAIEVLLNDLYLSLNPEVVEWFSYTQNRFPKSERDAKSKDLISKSLRKEFPRNAHWSGKWHYLTIPHIKFVTRSYPYFDFVLDLYLVASVETEWHKDYSGSFSERCIILEPIKKEIEKSQIPLGFLEAVSKGDLSQFEKRERDSSGYIVWYIPSLNKEVRLHGFLLESLHNAFKGKPLGPTLVYYGLLSLSEGIVAEQSLLESYPSKGDLEAPKETQEEVGKLSPKMLDDIISAITRLGKNKRDVTEAIEVTYYPPDCSLEDAIRFTLQTLGKGRLEKHI